MDLFSVLLTYLSAREMLGIGNLELSRACTVFCRSDFYTVQWAPFKEKIYICVRHWARGSVPTHTHTHTYMCVCVCVCVYIYIYIYIYTYTHTLPVTRVRHEIKSSVFRTSEKNL